VVTTQVDIGARVRQVIAAAMPDTPQGQIARQVGMTADAFSRALNGKRSFSAIELTELANLLGADIHWLITGAPDPKRALFAARHAYDFATGNRDVPGRAGDEAILRDIELAYRQAKSLSPTPQLPGSAAAIREVLGPDFVRPLAERVEEHLIVDVVRVAGLSTAYCFTIADRSVIVVPAVGNWFRENWDIAHELGHLAAGHLTNAGATAEQEAVANAFAAELLLPATALRKVNWNDVAEADLAQLVWDLGVSTDALARRLRTLGLITPLIERWSQQPTQRLLRYHWEDPDTPDGDAITARMDAAAARRFPIALERAHLARIAAGELPKDTLAWMLGVPPDTLEVDAPPEPPAGGVDDLAAALGLTLAP
jgi:Zn-dependent peptidase ImmA (M78 family)